MELVNKLKVILEEHSNLENKAPMETYMKHKFKFLGIKSPERKKLLRQFITDNKPEISYECRDLVQELYKLPQREFHYCAMEITDKFLRDKYEIKDIDLIKRMICDHSHWDSVDFIEQIRQAIAAARDAAITAILESPAPLSELRTQLFNLIGPEFIQDLDADGVDEEDILIFFDDGAGQCFRLDARFLQLRGCDLLHDR